jgi:hypothetical protein
MTEALIIPQLHSIEVRSLGVIRHASMSFTGGLNIIQTGSALGVTTLVHAFGLLVGGDHFVFKTATPEALARFSMNAQLSGDAVVLRGFKTNASDAMNDGYLGAGVTAYERLRGYMDRTHPGQCLVLDKEIFGCMDFQIRNQSFQELADLRAQVIAFASSCLSVETIRLQDHTRYALVDDPSDRNRSMVVPINS